MCLDNCGNCPTRLERLRYVKFSRTFSKKFINNGNTQDPICQLYMPSEWQIARKRLVHLREETRTRHKSMALGVSWTKFGDYCSETVYQTLHYYLGANSNGLPFVLSVVVLGIPVNLLEGDACDYKIRGQCPALNTNTYTFRSYYAIPANLPPVWNYCCLFCSLASILLMIFFLRSILLHVL